MAGSQCTNVERSGIQQDELVEVDKKEAVRNSEGERKKVASPVSEKGQPDEEDLKCVSYGRPVKGGSVSIEKKESGTDVDIGGRGRKRKEPCDDVVVAEDYVELYFYSEDIDKDDSEVFDELLELCSWYDPVDDRNSSYGNTDEEDEIISRLSANTVPRSTPPTLFKKNTSVGISLSALRLNSNLSKKPMQHEPSDFWDNLDAIEF